MAGKLPFYPAGHSTRGRPNANDDPTSRFSDPSSRHPEAHKQASKTYTPHASTALSYTRVISLAVQAAATNAQDSVSGEPEMSSRVRGGVLASFLATVSRDRLTRPHRPPSFEPSLGLRLRWGTCWYWSLLYGLGLACPSSSRLRRGGWCRLRWLPDPMSLEGVIIPYQTSARAFHDLAPTLELGSGGHRTNASPIEGNDLAVPSEEGVERCVQAFRARQGGATRRQSSRNKFVLR